MTTFRGANALMSQLGSALCCFTLFAATCNAGGIEDFLGNRTDAKYDSEMCSKVAIWSDTMTRHHSSDVCVAGHEQEPLVGQGLPRRLDDYEVTAVAISPANPNVLFAALPHGDLFRSADGGSTWTPFKNAVVTGVQDIVFDPLDAAIIYAGNFVGLYRSNNGGSKWIKLGDESGPERITRLAVDIRNTDHIYAGTEIGLFRSTDGGKTWARCGVGTGSDWVYDVRVNSSNTDDVFTLTSGGIFGSNDAGRTWRVIARRIGSPANEIAVMTIDPADSSVLYAATGVAVFKSTDGGASWSAVLNVDDWPRFLLVDPSNSRDVWLGTGSLYRSTDGGTSWSRTELVDQYINSLTPDMVARNVFYASSRFGVWKTTNGTTTWRSTGLSPMEIQLLSIAPSNPSKAYALPSNQALIFRTTNGGTSWESARGPSSCAKALAIDPVNANKLYVGDCHGNVYKSTNAGASWAKIASQLDLVLAMAIDPTRSTTIYAGTWGPVGHHGNVYQSKDGGRNWKPILEGEINRLAIDPKNTSTIYAAREDGLSKSTDGGTSWMELPLSGSVRSFILDPTHPATLFAGTLGVKAALLKSTDGGLSWKACRSNTDALAVDPSNSSIVYALQWYQFPIKSSDGGNSWARITRGLWEGDTNTLCPGKNSLLFAGTDSGIFSSRDGGASWVQVGGIVRRP